MHEIPQDYLVDYQNNFSHSVEAVPVVPLGMLRISCRCIPGIQ